MVKSNINALGIIFPNYYDSLVPELVNERLMGSIPFASRYRLIDFVLSSMVNSGINSVSVLVREKYHSLMDHLGSGREWDLVRKNGGLTIWPPYAEKGMNLYGGRIEALDHTLDYLRKQKEKYVQIALSKAERLEKLINELFEITKYNAHTVSLKKEKVDLQCLLAQVVDEIYPSLSAKGNSAAFTVDDDLVVYADPEKLARVFSNLLKNAAAYSYPNTEIIITAKRCGNSVQINFENHGRTIEPEQISGIFEKFNRLDEARLSDTGGAGLGLSIAEEIIRLHGGTITAFSENEMVSFVIMLPISD